MEWQPATVWWVLAGALVALEMVTGTFYLLMLALGAGAAALAAHAGATASLQWFAAAVAGGGATAAWHFLRARRATDLPATQNPDVNLDIGSRVVVEQWQADGTARVSYRGTTWTARHVGDSAPRAGEHVVVSVQGAELGLKATAGT